MAGLARTFSAPVVSIHVKVNFDSATLMGQITACCRRWYILHSVVMVFLFVVKLRAVFQKGSLRRSSIEPDMFVVFPIYLLTN
jgi:hypothetical protein